MRALLLLLFCLPLVGASQNVTVWKIGDKDDSAAELAIGPDGYKRFLSRDFGYEDGFYLVGRSAPGPWMPMSMVKMSPDNQNRGWQAGYQPSFETVGTFSHIPNGRWADWD